MSDGQGEAARQAAVMMLDDILKHHLTLDETLTQHHQKLTPQDRALASAICHKTLRHLGQIDQILFQLIKNPRPLRDHLALMILRAATAQLLFMRVPDHAAVDLAVGLAQKNHTRGILLNWSMPCCDKSPRNRLKKTPPFMQYASLAVEKMGENLWRTKRPKNRRSSPRRRRNRIRLNPENRSGKPDD